MENESKAGLMIQGKSNDYICSRQPPTSNAYLHTLSRGMTLETYTSTGCTPTSAAVLATDRPRRSYTYALHRLRTMGRPQ